MKVLSFGSLRDISSGTTKGSVTTPLIKTSQKEAIREVERRTNHISNTVSFNEAKMYETHRES